MEKRMMNPYLVLAIGIAAVSTSAILVKLSSAPSSVIAFYRLLFSVMLMLPIFLLKRYVSELKDISKRDLIFVFGAGVFLAFHFILWFESLKYTSVASSTVLVTLQPVFAFVGSYLFFKEKLSAKAIISGFIAIFGSVVISWGDFRVSGSAFFGDMLALVACALITFYFMFGQTVRKRVSLVTYTFVVYAISTVTLLIYVILAGEPLHGYHSNDWVYFILLAIVPTLFGHSLLNWVVKWVSTSTISVAILFEPVGATILAYYVLGETLVLSQITGGLIVIVGISLFFIDEWRIRMNSEQKLKVHKGIR